MESRWLRICSIVETPRGRTTSSTVEQRAPDERDAEAGPRGPLPEDDEVLAAQHAEGCRPVEVVVAELDAHGASGTVSRTWKTSWSVPSEASASCATDAGVP